MRQCLDGYSRVLSGIIEAHAIVVPPCVVFLR